MSREPANFSARAMARWLASRGGPHTKRQLPEPRPTLGQLQRSHCWTWVYCEKCLYRWFTGGFDRRDLKEAEALLNELVT